MTATGMKTNRGKCLALAAVLAMVVCAFAVALPADSDAADIAYFSGDITEDQEVAAGVIAEINGDMNIKNGATFTVSAGATLTVNTGVKVTVDGQGAADEGGDVPNAEFVVEDGARLIVNGEIVIGQYGEAAFASLPDVVADAETGIYTGTFIYGSVTAQNGGMLTIIAEVMNGGSVKVDSDGEQVSAIGGILAMLDGSTVYIEGNVPVALVIGAVGPDLSKAIPENIDILGAAVMLETTEEDSATDVSQLTFTATTQSNTVYSSGTKTTALVSHLDVSGVVRNAYLTIAHSENEEYEDKAADGKTVELSSSVTVTDELTVTETGCLIVGTTEDVEIPDTEIEAPNFDVSGTVTVAEDAILAFGKATVTVSGTFTAIDGFDASDLEAFAVAEGGELVLSGDVTFSKLSVAGTVTVPENVSLTVGALEIQGTVAVEETGTIDADVIYVGTTAAAMKAVSTGAAATLSGEGTVYADLIYVAAGASVDDAILEDLSRVVFQVQGADVVTVYGQSGTEVEAFEPVVKDGRFVSWYLSTDETQAAQTSVVLGTEAQTMVAKISADSGTGDNGMKATDYLLIVLAVLIVILVIAVVIRKIKG